MTAKITATLVNLTPHDIHLHVHGQVNTFPKFPNVTEARASELTSEPEILSTDPFGDGGFYVHVPMVNRAFGEVTGLPPKRPDIMYIVSQVVLDCCPDRDDLVTPYPVIRDIEGRVTGCTGFARRYQPTRAPV